RGRRGLDGIGLLLRDARAVARAPRDGPADTPDAELDSPEPRCGKYRNRGGLRRGQAAWDRREVEESHQSCEVTSTPKSQRPTPNQLPNPNSQRTTPKGQLPKDNSQRTTPKGHLQRRAAC